MNSGYLKLIENLEYLKLNQMINHLDETIDFMNNNQLSFVETLIKLTDYEIDMKQINMVKAMVKVAAFPHLKEIKDFDLTEQQSLSKRQLTQLEELNWLEQQYNLILLGPPGVGKTHIAIGIGIESIQKGFQVMFVTMGELVNLLKTEEYIRNSQVQLNRIRKSDLVIIDDLMYMAMDQREANLFFHLINHLYERSSIILTSNKNPDQWTELMGDQGITTAILDRLLHRVEVINLNGDSYRMKHRVSLFESESVQN